MTMLRLSGLALSVLLCAAPSLLAQDVIEVESGRTYEGTVLSNDGESVSIRTNEGMTLSIPMEQLTLPTQYRLRVPATAGDAGLQLELAEWCVEKTLYKEARAEFRKALVTDPLREEEINTRFVKARTTAANELLARGKSLQAADKDAEARRVLSALVQELPLEPASAEAAQLLAAETTERKAGALNRKPSRAAAKPADAGSGADVPLREDGEPFSDATRQRFEPVLTSYHKLLDETHDGLVKGGSAGLKLFEKALTHGEKIRAAVAELDTFAANDPEIAEALALAASKLEEALVDVRINMVDSYMLRSSYNQAADVVRAGLAEYPQNESLRHAMNRVTAATAESSDGGWVTVRGGR